MSRLAAPTGHVHYFFVLAGPDLLPGCAAVRGDIRVAAPACGFGCGSVVVNSCACI